MTTVYEDDTRTTDGGAVDSLSAAASIGLGVIVSLVGLAAVLICIFIMRRRCMFSQRRDYRLLLLLLLLLLLSLLAVETWQALCSRHGCEKSCD